ncbi:hypothetical protein ACO0QE_000525 [Hanseniaspora vineae]
MSSVNLYKVYQQAPQLALPNTNNNNSEVLNQDLIRFPPLPQKYKERSTTEIYFDKSLFYFADHPVIAGFAGFFALYIAAGTFKSGSKLIGRLRMGGKGVNGNGAGGPRTYFMGGFDGKMNNKEALEILSLKEEELTKKKLKEVHRKIMLANHPDKGGSPYLATKINEAKDFLVKNASFRK